MSKEMSAEYKSVSKQIKDLLSASSLDELEKYSILSANITAVAHLHNGQDFQQIKLKLALVCKTMLGAIEAAEKIFGKHKK